MSAYSSGLALGIIFAVLFVAIVMIVRKMRGDNCTEQFDERQLLARNKAYQFGFFAFLVAVCIDACLKLTGIAPYFDPVGEFAAVFVAVTVFAIQAIRQDAFMALNRRWRSQLILYIVICIMQFLSAASYLKEGTLVQDGKLTLKCVGPLCGIVFLVIVVVMVIHHHNEAVQMEEE